MGSLEFLCFLTGTFGELPLTYFYLPKRARAYLLSQSVKIRYFCSGPISVDPIRPQRRTSSRTGWCPPSARWRSPTSARCPSDFYILQRGVQWKQGVVVYIILWAVLLYNTTPIHCAPLRLRPPVMNTQ